jgi:hypothetical protein
MFTNSRKSKWICSISAWQKICIFKNMDFSLVMYARRSTPYASQRFPCAYRADFEKYTLNIKKPIGITDFSFDNSYVRIHSVRMYSVSTNNFWCIRHRICNFCMLVRRAPNSCLLHCWVHQASFFHWGSGRIFGASGV